MTTGAVTLRFVNGTEFSSKLIELRENTALPFAPSHVELALPEGYLGALLNGGVQLRPHGYDKGTYSNELFVDVPCADANAGVDYAKSKLLRGYDWAAILDYAVPTNFHLDHDFICSALMADTLQAGKAFPGTLAVPTYLISPRDLLLLVSALVKLP